jgi:hypothetical protein
LLASVKPASYDPRVPWRHIVSRPSLFEDQRPVFKSKAAVAALTALSLAGGLTGCSRDGDILQTGIITSYSACPPVAVVAPTGDITLFNPENSRDAAAIDVVAHITNVRSTCQEVGDQLVTTTTFQIQGQRRDARGQRDIVLPYFAAVVQGGRNVVAKRVSRVGLSFAEGQQRATAAGTATSQVSRAAATLPEDIRRRLTAERRAGDPSAAIDPLSDPAVRAAVDRASFEMLIGFELTADQLRYNATR